MIINSVCSWTKWILRFPVSVTSSVTYPLNATGRIWRSPLIDVQFLKCLIFVAFMESVSLNSPMPIPLHTVKIREMFIPFTHVEFRRARVSRAEESGKRIVAMSPSLHAITRSFDRNAGPLVPVMRVRAWALGGWRRRWRPHGWWCPQLGLHSPPHDIPTLGLSPTALPHPSLAMGSSCWRQGHLCPDLIKSLLSLKLNTFLWS